MIIKGNEVEGQTQQWNEVEDAVSTVNSCKHVDIFIAV